MIGQEHLTADRINALKARVLTTEEMIAALEHIGECKRCAGSLAESYCERQILNLSPDFSAEIFSAIEKDKTIRFARNRRKRELCFYSFKVSVAACIALVLLFTGTFNQGMNFSRSIQTNLSGVNVITENLRGFSDKLIDFKSTTNLKEEY